METHEITLEYKASTDDEKKIFAYLTNNRTFFVYNGEIDYFFDKKIIKILKQSDASENIVFFLTTPGGDPDSAYKLSRYLQQNYKMFSLAVLGACKSAGTLFALGAHEVIMNSEGEFGPLDVQLFRPDEFMNRTSGLTISQSLSYIGNKAFETFENVFLGIRKRSGGVITTTTAADIASSVVTGIYSPITAKIDPLTVGEMQRSLDVAVHYGIRLGADEHIVQHLAKNYPSHSFVIDSEEAQGLFNNVRAPNIAEQVLIKHIEHVLTQEFKFEPFSIINRKPTAFIIKLSEVIEEVSDDPETHNKEIELGNESTAIRKCNEDRNETDEKGESGSESGGLRN